MIVALLDHLPERHVRVVAVAGHVHRRHLERIGLHLERALSAEEGFTPQRVDVRDLFVGHRVAAARRAVAMHHQLRAGAPQRFVERVGVAHVERQIIRRLRIHLRRRDVVEAFRRLAVAFLDLGTEVAGPSADRIGLQQRELAGAVLFPDLELGLLLEQPHQHRRLQVHVLGGDFGDQLFRNRLVGLGVAGERHFGGVAAGQRQTGGQNGGGDERANERAAKVQAMYQSETPQPRGNDPRNNRLRPKLAADYPEHPLLASRPGRKEGLQYPWTRTVKTWWQGLITAETAMRRNKGTSDADVFNQMLRRAGKRGSSEVHRPLRRRPGERRDP